MTDIGIAIKALKDAGIEGFESSGILVIPCSSPVTCRQSRRSMPYWLPRQRNKQPKPEMCGATRSMLPD